MIINLIDKMRFMRYNIAVDYAYFIVQGGIVVSTEQFYRTKQRQMILDYLSGTGDGHITVAEIQAHFKLCGTHIGTATVYRHLEKFILDGLVRKYHMDGVNGACFQYIGKNEDCKSHVHFKCVDCGALQCIDCDRLDELRTHFSEEHGFRVDSARTVFYGKCAECLKKEDNKRNE